MADIDSLCFVSHGLSNFLFPSASDTAGGAERQQYLLARELDRRGYDVTAIVGECDRSERSAIGDVDVIEGCPNGADNVAERASNALTLLRLFHRADSDLYYVRGHHFDSIVTALYCSLTGASFLYCIANDSDIDPEYIDRYNPVIRFLYAQSMKRADLIVTQTEYQQELLETEYGIDSTVIPNGYMLPPESEVHAPDDREFVLWVGEVEPEKKRPDRFLALAASLPEVEFVLVGPPGPDGAYVSRVRDRADSLANVTYEGFVPPDEMATYFSRALALVNTSDYEGFPNTFLEAWRYETPVVSLFHELDGVLDDRGIGFQSGSQDRLTTDVRRIVEDDALRTSMGEKGRQFLRDNYQLDRVVDEYEAVFSTA